MNLIPPLIRPDVIVYPESDGLPMAENTKQLRWIVVLFGNLSAQFRDTKDVFVGGNQFWYPVEGEPNERIAPDVYVVFGRPKGDRPSYKQWEEANLPMTVVFEVLSPSNTVREMINKLDFYEDHGVEEYYLFDPDSNALCIYVRQGAVLSRVRNVKEFVSPRLRIRFDLSDEKMIVYGPDGKPFLTFEELTAAHENAEQRTQKETQRADEEAQRAQKEAQRADEEAQRADHAEQRARRVLELSSKVRRGQASAEELQELDRLEGKPAPPA